MNGGRQQTGQKQEQEQEQEVVSLAATTEWRNFDFTLLWFPGLMVVEWVDEGGGESMRGLGKTVCVWVDGPLN